MGFGELRILGIEDERLYLQCSVVRAVGLVGRVQMIELTGFC